jgi:hypothetical protein
MRPRRVHIGSRCRERLRRGIKLGVGSGDAPGVRYTAMRPNCSPRPINGLRRPVTGRRGRVPHTAPRRERSQPQALGVALNKRWPNSPREQRLIRGLGRVILDGNPEEYMP